MTFLAFAFLVAGNKGLRSRRIREPLALSEWLTGFRELSGPMRICTSDIWIEPLETWQGTPRERDQRQRWRRRELSDEIARRLRSHGAVALARRDSIIWLELGDGPRRITDDWLLRRSGGFVESVCDSGVHENGAAALVSACSNGLLGPSFQDAILKPRAIRPADVKHSFKDVMPSGSVYATDEPVPPWLAGLPSADKRRILADAAAFARSFQTTARPSGYDVTAFCEQGELRLIFVADANADYDSAREWHALIKQLNVDAAVGSIVGVA